MRFDIITIFPRIFDSYVTESLFKRAKEKGILEIKTHNLRDYTTDRHHKVDDRPFGGGPGMVIKVEPVAKAVKKLTARGNQKKTRVILFSLRGKKLTAAVAKRLATYDRLIMICGRYEGVDERVAQHIADEEISIGDYVLSGGELPALVLVEAVARFIPGFLGKYESLETIKGSHPAYTRPEIFKFGKGKGWPVPKVLLSGNHKNIENWRRK
ncbi:MAG TPA: tRNA (guanosine(37)-N1)-methyltransferase TrmD [Candidatus Paceibacterota bacterium]|nr:tRNA (guanosine(37)-N1)-methyltransferase TrmD [Candidatus Paceibacterota bacterium]